MAEVELKQESQDSKYNGLANNNEELDLPTLADDNTDKEDNKENKQEAKAAKKLFKENPLAFLDNAKDYKDMTDFNLADYIVKAAAYSGGSGKFLQNAKDYQGINGLDLAGTIHSAADINPQAFLENAQDYKGIFENKRLAGEIRLALEKAPGTFLENYGNYKDILNEEQMIDCISRCATVDARTFLYLIPSYITMEPKWFIEGLKQAGKLDPNTLLRENILAEIDKFKSLITNENDPKAIVDTIDEIIGNNLVAFLNNLTRNLKGNGCYLENVIGTEKLYKNLSEGADKFPDLFLQIKNLDKFRFPLDSTREDESGKIHYFNMLEKIENAAEQKPKVFLNNIRRNYEGGTGGTKEHTFIFQKLLQGSFLQTIELAIKKEPSYFLANIADSKEWNTGIINYNANEKEQSFNPSQFKKVAQDALDGMK
ncbi:MAG: hypothetical protein WAZ12_00305 [Candidatus Absconditicoccaceae bacterium]